MRRAQLLRRLEDSRGWDLAIVGGGATGLGIAVEGAARGYRTLLVEQSDFCKGTSSRSTKLIHGGVRYLKQGNLSLVREGLRERGILVANAPHLVRRIRLLVPCYRFWEKGFYGLGLKFYDWLSGELGLGSSRMLSTAKALAAVPTLAPRRLRGGVLFFDAQFDDARLGLSLARTAWGLGAVPLNYVEAIGFTKAAGKISALGLKDTISGREIEVSCRIAIDAAGVFSDRLRRLDDPSTPPRTVASRGSHLVLGQDFLPGDTAVLIPRTDDGRVVFLIPWQGCTLIGTTDIPIDEPSIEPTPLSAEIDYLLEYAGRYLDRKPVRADILSVFCGLRPLLKPEKGEATSEISREHSIGISRSGLLSVNGGKWTTYRKMAKEAVDRAVESAGLPKWRGSTEHLRIDGYCEVPAGPPLEAYGAQAASLKNLIADEPELGEPLHPRLRQVKAQVIWAVREEMAQTVEDVLSRRTRALLLDARAAIEAAPETARLMAQELTWDLDRQESEADRFARLAQGYLA